ncbi:Ankyrin repeat domain-containing protein 16 [Lamellibrachia satsuma]|nr:Ankyrin repeat domain-containing protein 16 [Lamellibrachia satsuma]
MGNYQLCRPTNCWRLQVAARCGQLDVLKFVYTQCVTRVINGVPALPPLALEQANLDGKRPLHEAAQNGHLACLVFLLSRGVDVDSLKRADWTPLMLACTKTNLAIIKELVHAGSRPELRNKDGWHSLHIACREGNKEVIEFLLEKDPELWNTRSNNGRTPLHTAALHGRLDACKVLLQWGRYKVDETDCCGTTPLMDAFRSGHTDVADLLLWQQKADITKEDRLGRQCLHLAAEAGCAASVVYLSRRRGFDEGHLGMIHLLVSLGADVHRKDNKGRTALDMAHSCQQKDCGEVLRNHGGRDSFDETRVSTELFVKSQHMTAAALP